jgi:DNA-binding GntR family transcriptional regulator
VPSTHPDEYSAELRADHVGRWGELNTALHGLLYRHADQPRTADIVASLLQNADRYTRMHISFTQGRSRAEREHAGHRQALQEGRCDERLPRAGRAYPQCWRVAHRGHLAAAKSRRKTTARKSAPDWSTRIET